MTTLKVFWPDDASSASSTLTLGYLFEKEILPRRPFWDPRTRAEYVSTVHLWCQITGDPPVRQIDEKTIAGFCTKLMTRRGKNGQQLSKNTVRKHLRHLKAMLRILGPRTVRGIGLLRELPLIEMPRPIHRIVTTFTPQEMRSLASASEYFQTTLTHPVPARDWWHSLIVILFNTAWRIGTALSVRWEWINDSWIDVPAEAMKRRDCARRFYLNTASRKALDKIRCETGPIFPWHGTVTTLQRWRRRLQRKIGLPEDALHGFHCLRRTALSTIALINPLVAKIVAGHAVQDVLATHYISETVIQTTLEQLVQPW